MKTVVLAEAQWPTGSADDQLPEVAGFVESAFSPLVAALADLCLASHFGAPPAGLAEGERTAIVVASSTGDLATAAAVAAAVQAGRRVPPLLFYQSNPNAVAGYIAARWGLSGPVMCTMPGSAVRGDDADSRARAEALAYADILIESGDADAALVIAANAYLGGAASGTATLIGPTSWSSRDPDPERDPNRKRRTTNLHQASETRYRKVCDEDQRIRPRRVLRRRPD